MLKYFGQFLAIVAVLASAINAQCAISCSMQTMTRSAAGRTTSVHAPRTGHACCPEQNAPVPSDQNQHQQPCPDPSPNLSALAVPLSLQHLDVPQSFDSESAYSFVVAIRVQRSPLAVVVDSSGLPDIPPFSVLRL